MAKRKSIFRPDFGEEFSFLKSSNKGNSFAYCTICHVDINLASAGISSVKKHIDTIKHSSSQQMKTSTQSLGLFFKERYSPISLKISAAEGIFAFHTVKHHHSFRTMDCTSNLLSVCFSDSDIAKNFHSARTKTEAIITGVLAPMSIEEVLSELQTGITFSLSTDASNHAELKTFPIIIRYFNSSGVQNKLLDFVHLQDEKAKHVAEMLLDIIAKYELNPENMIAFCADNAPVNFGGINRAAGENVFTKLKQIQSKLIPVGCPSHLVHKAAQIAGERALSVDIESIVAKISSFFSGEKSGVLQRHQKLIEF